MRRLRGDGGATRRRRGHPLDRDQRLPGPRRRPGQPGSDHRRRPGRARRGCTRCRQEMAERGGSQCGYCTPGFICSMASEYYRADRVPPPRNSDGNGKVHGGGPSPRVPSRAAEVEPNASGAAAERADDGAQPTTDPTAPGNAPTTSTDRTVSICTRCPETSAAVPAIDRSGMPLTRWARRPRTIRWWSASRAPAPAPAGTRIVSGQGDFIRPTDLAQALDLLAEHPTAVLVAGSTDWGVELNIRHSRAATTIAIDRLSELRTLVISKRHHRHRRSAEPVGGRARAGRADPAAGTDVAAVRFPADPQRRDAGRQPRDRFADRRQPAGAAGVGCVAGAGVQRRASERSSSPTTSPDTGSRSAGRGVDQAHPDSRAGRADQRIPQDRQATVRRHLQRGGRFRSAPGRYRGRPSSDIKIGLGGVAATPLRAGETEAPVNGQPWTREVVDPAARHPDPRGHPDQRPPGQRGLPRRDARRVTAQVPCTEDAARRRAAS